MMPHLRAVPALIAAGQPAPPAAASGWRADPQTVRHNAERQPTFNFDESQTPNYELPDALRTDAGGPVKTAEAWQARRAVLLDLFAREMFGRSPAQSASLTFDVIEEDPHAMSGAATLRRVAVRSEHRGERHAFTFTLFAPNAAQTPAPAFVFINNRGDSHTDPTRAQVSEFWPAERMIARGHAVAAFQNGDVAPDDKQTFRSGIMRLFADVDQPAAADAWGALAAWAWGASRVMDYLERDASIDASRVAVVGHSRGGKAALWAGATDERFALVVSNNSGCGGAAISRRRLGETVAKINTSFPHWFCGNFKQYGEREDALPFDQHMLISLIAPRAVYVASADDDLWADPRGEFLSLAHASPVYALWGHAPIAPDAMPPLDTPLQIGPRGYHVRRGGHGLTPWDWDRYMDMADQLGNA